MALDSIGKLDVVRYCRAIVKIIACKCDWNCTWMRCNILFIASSCKIICLDINNIWKDCTKIIVIAPICCGFLNMYILFVVCLMLAMSSIATHIATTPRYYKSTHRGSRARWRRTSFATPACLRKLCFVSAGSCLSQIPMSALPIYITYMMGGARWLRRPATTNTTTTTTLKYIDCVTQIRHENSDREHMELSGPLVFMCACVWVCLCMRV